MRVTNTSDVKCAATKSAPKAERSTMKIPNGFYFTVVADYENGICTKCGWNTNNHGHDSEREQDICVYERVDEK